MGSEMCIRDRYPAPTPTQAQSWPIALSGRDIISVARTGSGKTLGFLLPAFHAMLDRPGGMKPRMGAGPYIVVLAPTRELACQINEEATKFGKSSGIRSTTVYGETMRGEGQPFTRWVCRKGGL